MIESVKMKLREKGKREESFSIRNRYITVTSKSILHSNVDLM